MNTAAARRLTPADLMPLEQYARERGAFRARVIEHKRLRTVAIGPNVTWLFEDRLTIQYQVQEMLRVERIFEPKGIDEELAAYNPLIPDGTNWKITLLVEFPDAAQRQRELARLKGIENRAYAMIGDLPKSFAIADEDLERENAEKTSAVHFLRIELSVAHRASLAAGARLAFGIDHPDYRHECVVEGEARAALLRDLQVA